MQTPGLRWSALLTVIGLPLLLIYASGLPHWVGRTIGDGILCYSVIVLFTGFAISPKKMTSIGQSRTKDRQQMKPGVRALVQLLSAVLATFLWWIWGVPYGIDVAKLAAGGGPTRIVGRVCEVGGAIYGLNFLKKSVYLCDGHGGANRSYTLFYSIGGPQPGGNYELTLLPRSRMLLDAKEIR
jgi:hypothetical protein